MNATMSRILLALAFVGAMALFVQPLVAQSAADELTFTPKFAADKAPPGFDESDLAHLAQKPQASADPVPAQ